MDIHPFPELPEATVEFPVIIRRSECVVTCYDLFR